jgi:CRISPR-associated protein Cmr4
MTENDTKMYWIQAITPLHVGSGKGIGFIDMPIMREKVTNWPVVPGSAMKGVLRDHFTYYKKASSNLIDIAFGKSGKDTESNAGSLVLTDARIVCMPVRSLYGTFAYVTSPLVLERLRKDLVAAGCTGIPDKTPDLRDGEAYCDEKPVIVSGNQIFFEDLDFTVKKDDMTASQWSALLAGKVFSDNAMWQKIFRERFAILSDDCFGFMTENGTEVAAHIKIDDIRKIAAGQALWYEEALPPESILAGIAWCDRLNISKTSGEPAVDQKKIFDTFCNGELNLQIGGKATVGKGRVRCFFPRG